MHSLLFRLDASTVAVGACISEKGESSLKKITKKEKTSNTMNTLQCFANIVPLMLTAEFEPEMILR